MSDIRASQILAQAEYGITPRLFVSRVAAQVEYGLDTVPPVTTVFPPGGSYPGGIAVTLTANEPAAIYYTVDGSEPSPASARYVDLIVCIISTSLRFFAVDTAGNRELSHSVRYEITETPGKELVDMSSANISFSGIPSSIRKPGVYMEFNTALAVRTLPANLQKMLLIAQRTAAATVAAATPTQIFTDAEAAGYFGIGSMAHLMARAAITANPYLNLTVCALDDGAGAAATVTLTFTVTTAGGGVLGVTIGGRLFELAVAAGSVNTVIAAGLKALLDKYPDLPVKATVATNVVTLTALNKGTVGNQIDVAASCTATGVTTVVSAASLTGGTIDPDITLALIAVAATQYDIVVSPYNDATNLGLLKTHLETYGGPMEQRPGIGVFGYDGVLANATTLAGTINSGRMVGAYLRGALEPAFCVGAALGAVLAGEEDPARPLNSLGLTGITAPPVASRLTRGEQEACLYGGITPLEVGPGEIVQIVRAVTTYTMNAMGSPDISLLDVTTIRTLDYVRKAIRERCRLRFPREKLSTKTPPKVRSEILDVLFKLEELEIIENVELNKDGVLAEKDAMDPNRLDVKIPTDVVNGLHILAARIDLIL